MLVQLRIQGLAIIESAMIEFSPRFNVITGETGAGKSILIKALGLMFGAKANQDVVRQGFDVAEVCGVYELPENHGALDVLQRIGVRGEKDAGKTSVILRRQVTNKGKSNAWINDTPVTLSSLRELGYALIDILGQFDNQKLLDSSEHLSLVDEFLDGDSVQKKFDGLFSETLGVFLSIREDLSEFRTKIRDKDYLQFRLEEIEKFSPSKEDYLKVQEKAALGKSAYARQDKLNKIQSIFDEGGGGQALSQALWDAANLLQDVSKLDSRFSVFGEEMGQLASRLDDMSYEIGRAANQDEYNEDELEEAQARLARYQELMRRFSAADIDAFMAETEKVTMDLNFVENFTRELKTKLKNLLRNAQALSQSGDLLSKARQSAAKNICKRIETELADLQMKGSVFEVSFQPVSHSWEALPLNGLGDDLTEIFHEAIEILSDISRHGKEKAQFLLSANPGEPPKPLHKIASGGEISRIMLALKKALSVGAETCVLVFDEIDSGISGRTADVVGKKMRELSKSFQVVCISHLAQVAAYADKHFLVEKFVQSKRTESRIVGLADDASAHEIARLLSGTEISEPSLANARLLKEKASRW